MAVAAISGGGGGRGRGGGGGGVGVHGSARRVCSRSYGGSGSGGGDPVGHHIIILVCPLRSCGARMAFIHT